MRAGPSQPHSVLLTGTSGYVGGKLLQALQQTKQYRIRSLSRRSAPQRFEGDCEFVRGDIFDREVVESALRGIDTAFYLIHSMGAQGDFKSLDREAARNFGDCARKQGVRRIIYLGGLGRGEGALSDHLRSRQEVGEILRQSGVQVVEFRCSVVIGAGSLSFEMIRALVDKLPVMVTPRWVSMKTQPIAVGDLMQYLLHAVKIETRESHVFEIGGSEVVSYGDLMQCYAKVRGIRFLMFPIPFLTPYLSSLWLGLVTPLYAKVGRSLIESIVYSTVVHDQKASEFFALKPISVEEAIRQALLREQEEFDSLSFPELLRHSRAVRTKRITILGSRLFDARSRKLSLPAEKAFLPASEIGGANGWLAFNWLWRLRGLLDRVFGGVGFRKGRPTGDLQPGDTIDFWRVEVFEAGSRMRLRAEMKLPGRAWLEFATEQTPSGCVLHQTAVFEPRSLLGYIYWYLVFPLHELVFSGMLDSLAKKAKRL